MNTHKELMQVAHELADERNAIAPVVAGFAGSWRVQLEARDRLIEKLWEALERMVRSGKAHGPAELGIVRTSYDAHCRAADALAAYREWKENSDDRG